MGAAAQVGFRIDLLKPDLLNVASNERIERAI
jgi:hypothetical protein